MIDIKPLRKGNVVNAPAKAKESVNQVGFLTMLIPTAIGFGKAMGWISEDAIPEAAYPYITAMLGLGAGGFMWWKNASTSEKIGALTGLSFWNKTDSQ